MQQANWTFSIHRQQNPYCFGRYNRIKVVKAFESAWIVGFEVVDDGFLYYADGVVWLPACMDASMPLLWCLWLEMCCEDSPLQLLFVMKWQLAQGLTDVGSRLSSGRCCL